MLGQLIPCGGGDPIPLFKPKLLVGRRDDCDVVLPLSTVSAKHCSLEFRNGYWFVRDLASRNGIRVDGHCCDEEWLFPGSTLWIAQHRYEMDYTAEGSAPVPTARGSQTAPPEPSPVARQTDSPLSGPIAPETSRPLTDRGTDRSSGAVRPGLGELIPCGGGDPIPLDRPMLLVGRSSRCDISLSYPTVSGKHCELEFKDGYWFVRDLGSRNGTRVNGYVYQSKCLMPGDFLWISKHRYEIVYTPQAAEPPPEEDPFALSLLEKAGLANPDEGGPLPRWQQIDDGHVPKQKWTLDE